MGTHQSLHWIANCDIDGLDCTDHQGGELTSVAGLDPPWMRLRYDASFNNRTLPSDGDELLTEIPCRLPSVGAGIDLINLPTGTGKTVCALAVLLLRLCDDVAWKSMTKNHMKQVERARSKGSGNGICSSNTIGVTELLRLAVVRCTSSAMQEHFQQQLAILLPCIMPLLPVHVSLEIWCGTVCDDLKNLSVDRVRVLRGGSMEKAMRKASIEKDTAVIWFMSMESKHNHKLQLKKGMPSDPWSPLACNCIIPFELLDEMTEVSAPLLEGQDPVVLHRMVTNATPTNIIRNGKLNSHHWFHNVIPKHTASVMRVADHQAPLGSREEVRSGLYGLLMMSLITTPLSMVHVVGQDFINDLPTGLVVCPIPTRSSTMIPTADNRDDLSQMGLIQWIRMQFNWALLARSEIKSDLDSCDASQHPYASHLLPHLNSLLLKCNALLDDDTS